MGADAEPIPISLMDLIAKHIRVIGSTQNGPDHLYEALDFVAQALRSKRMCLSPGKSVRI